MICIIFACDCFYLCHGWRLVSDDKLPCAQFIYALSFNISQILSSLMILGTDFPASINIFVPLR